MIDTYSKLKSVPFLSRKKLKNLALSRAIVTLRPNKALVPAYIDKKRLLAISRVFRFYFMSRGQTLQHRTWNAITLSLLGRKKYMKNTSP